MTKAPSEINRASPNKPHHPKHHQRTLSLLSYSPKLSIFILIICVTLYILFHIQHSLQTPPSLTASSTSVPSRSLMQQWLKVINNSLITSTNCSSTTTTTDHQLDSLSHKLHKSVTFLPLKDIRYAHAALEGRTWFMSSMYDTHQEGEVQYQQFPSESSNGRLLCLKGRDNHDGSWNSYALAWPEALPFNATFMKGLTFVSYNHYNYENIWHGLSAMVPFVAWHIKANCSIPTRWILYHWGELRLNMGVWLKTLMEATFDEPSYIEALDYDGVDEGVPVCFEEAVVMRHNEGGMSRKKRMEVYDLMRCKARAYCNVTLIHDRPAIGMTLFMRAGARSFRNETSVVEIFQKQCAKVDGCRLMVAHSNNLSFCEQVKVMGLTDILVSPHGAQLTNMFFMDKNSSVMEFFPKGWLKVAGIGQYVYHWIASWAGMKHQGAWRDPDGDECPYPEDDRRCMSIFKDGRIGCNETYFAEWARNVLDEVKTRKKEEASKNTTTSSFMGCACS